MEATCAPEFWSKEEMQIWRKASGLLTDRRESGTHTPHGQDRRAGWSAHLSLVDLVPVGGGLACYQHRPHTRAQWGGMRGTSHGAHPWQEDATGGVCPSQGQGGLLGAEGWGQAGGPHVQEGAAGHVQDDAAQGPDVGFLAEGEAEGFGGHPGLLEGVCRQEGGVACMSPGLPGETSNLKMGPWSLSSGEGETCCLRPQVSKILAHEAEAHQASCVRP